MSGLSDGIGGILTFVQVFFAVIVGLYFWNLIKNQHVSRFAVEKESKKELEKLQRLRAISLTEPLTERTRPVRFEDIVGQNEGLKALRAAICGPNPQHVLIYGPPGVGKTAVARLVLEEARKSAVSPFKENAKFVEVDGTCARFDERGIADPLIGSVHDPIYQGAGPMGMAGIPQPKAGAVTRAHGGLLFIDEIGELHPIQLNKLLKVMEDRKVILESAYYSADDPNIPGHIHDIFQNGLPADFRMVGATTRSPESIAEAIRSRCLEIFFRPLAPAEIETIAAGAAKKINYPLSPEVLAVISRFAANGREAVNIVQIAVGIAITENRHEVTVADIEWVIQSGRYSPRLDRKVPGEPQVGVVNALAVTGPNTGLLLELEAGAMSVVRGTGRVTVTGVVEEEEMGGGGKTLRRKGMAKSSVENVLTVLRATMDVDWQDYDIHINFPGGIPIDGPSAGVAVATAVYSAITGVPVDNRVAMTGEVSIRGLVMPVGGVVAKVEAARAAGARLVYIPAENNQELFREIAGVEVVPVKHLREVIAGSLVYPKAITGKITVPNPSLEVLGSPSLMA